MTPTQLERRIASFINWLPWALGDLVPEAWADDGTAKVEHAVHGLSKEAADELLAALSPRTHEFDTSGAKFVLTAGPSMWGYGQEVRIVVTRKKEVARA